VKKSNLNTELEVKFALTGLGGVENRLLANGGRLVSGRVHEINLRFDTPSFDLTQNRRVLRLRRDLRTYLTYKGPGEIVDGVQRRTEIEIDVDDFDKARLFLEALGYQVNMIYEKFRTTYSYRDVLVCLDEMPYGTFIELEGGDAPSIRQAAEGLTLPWEAAIQESYAAIFERLRSRLGFTFRDLTFDNFIGIQNSLVNLDIPIIDL